MAYISKFKTDTAYSNEDINQVLSAITGSGVLPSSPNDILLNVAQDGVAISDMQCRVEWADEGKTSVKICPGTVIMSDGSYIILSDEILAVPSTELHYIYIHNDIILQNIPVCSPSLPQDNSSYVLLATTQDKKITDKRRLALSKIGNYGAHPVLELSGTVSFGNDYVKPYTTLLSFDIGEGYSKVILTCDDKSSINIFNLNEGVFELRLHKNDSKCSSAAYATVDMLKSVGLDYSNGVLSLFSPEGQGAFVAYSRTFYLTVF